MGVIVPGVVLSAGRSRRMGRPKALLPTTAPGETFLGRIVRVLRQGGVDDVVVVVGPDSPPAMTVWAGHLPPPRVVVNSTPDAGQLSSLLAGLRAIDRPGVAGMMVTLVDVPLIDPEIVKMLLERHRETRPPIVRPARQGRHGHPVIFDRSVFDELRRADPETGAKPVVHAHRHEAVEVEPVEDGPFLDIDTPADYERAFGRPPPDDDPRNGERH